MIIPLVGLGGCYSAVIDDDDARLVLGLPWYAARRHKKIYAAANLYEPDHTIVYMHRLIRPDIPMIDHHDGDGLNNRRSNLRPCDHRKNGANSTKRPGVHPYKGVRHRPDKGARSGKSWEARVGGKCLGYFTSAEEAALAYNASAIQVFGEFARINEIHPEGQ